MAPSLAAQMRSFWHDLTSNDRHAGPDAPFRTSQHHPLAQSKSTPLASTSATSAYESRTDMDHDLEAGHGGFVTHSIGGTASPPHRGSLQRQSSGFEGIGTGEIQMQSFSDGLPPPPPVSHSWRRIDRWMEDNYEELFEQLGAGATINDINELEHELDCTLPQEVRESLQIHDGQERGGRPTGVVFGCMLLDCEEITHEWQNWRTVNEAYFNDSRTYQIPQAPLKAFAGSSSSAAPTAQSSQSTNTQWRADLLDKQDSQPPNAIQKTYAHPAWIPLARDWGGNNIAIDLAPGPAGRWGQVILMGRDYDCKYVISRSWSAFVATLADDMNTSKWFIDEDTKELKLREFKQPGVEPAYIDILRWRTDQKYGRRPPKKRALRVNSNVSAGPGQGGAGVSPYASPIESDRGRSPHRYSSSNGKAPVGAGTSSPRAHIGSPLARVTEEVSSQPLKLDSLQDDAHNLSSRDEKLISLDSPHPGADEEKAASRRGSLPFPRSRLSSNVLNSEDEESQPLSPAKELQDEDEEEALGNGMKEVKI